MVDTTGLCFVITDGVRARFVRADPRHHPHTILTVDRGSVRAASESSPGRDAASRDPPRSRASRFTRLLAERLSHDFAADIFTALVLVAPPPVLRQLSAMLDGPTSGCLVGSLARNVIDVSDVDLPAHLERWLSPEEND
jgi:protein required for attachment to host cells